MLATNGRISTSHYINRLHLSNIFNNRNIRTDSINLILASTTFITFINSYIIDFISSFSTTIINNFIYPFSAICTTIINNFIWSFSTTCTSIIINNM